MYSLKRAFQLSLSARRRSSTVLLDCKGDSSKDGSRDLIQVQPDRLAAEIVDALVSFLRCERRNLRQVAGEDRRAVRFRLGVMLHAEGDA